MYNSSKTSTNGWENSQELTHFNPRSYPRHLVGKRTAQNKTPSKHHHQRQPGEHPYPMQLVTASLTLNIYFYLFSSFKSNKNNKTYPHPTSKTTNEPKQKSRLGTASNKITGVDRGVELVCGRTKRTNNTVSESNKRHQKHRFGIHAIIIAQDFNRRVLTNIKPCIKRQFSR